MRRIFAYFVLAIALIGLGVWYRGNMNENFFLMYWPWLLTAIVVTTVVLRFLISFTAIGITVAGLVFAILFWLSPIVVGSVLLFFLGFALVAFLLSPIYAIRSADAYDRAFKEQDADMLRSVVFKYRVMNRLNQRDKGERPIDFVGLIPSGENFWGETFPEFEFTKNEEGFWELTKEPIPTTVNHPGLEIHKYWIIRFWVWYINLFTDVALVGTKKLFKARWYPIEKTRYEKVQRETENGETETIFKIIPPASPSNPERKIEYSDHVRIAPFDWVIAIAGAETKDRLSWNMLIVVNVKVVNPWRTLNNHENWSRFLSNAITDAAVRGLRKLSIDDIVMLAVEKEGEHLGDEARDKIIESIRRIDDRLYKIIGIRFAKTAEAADLNYSGDVQILSIEPRFRNPDDRLAFTQKWRAEQQASEELILGEAEALRESTVIDAVARAVEDHGKAGMLVQRMQALENAASFGSTIVFDSGPGGTSNIEKLLALQLEEQRKKKGGA